jgi:hypothetical protein
MLPRLRNASPDAVILADGFSCRTQIHELNSGGREALHLAELLYGALSRPEPQPGQPLEVAYGNDKARPPGGLRAGPISRFRQRFNGDNSRQGTSGLSRT